MSQEHQISEALFYTLLQVLKVFRCIFRDRQYPQLAPGHFRIMSYLLDSSHNLQELAERAMVTPATMSRTIDTLEEHGWVDREQNQADRRQVVITLTEKGQALLGRFRKDVVDEISSRLTVLSETELKELNAGLVVLSRVFNDSQDDLQHSRRKQ